MRKESLTYKFLTWFERAVIAGLIFLMAVTVLFSALDLGWLVVQKQTARAPQFSHGRQRSARHLSSSPSRAATTSSGGPPGRSAA